MLRAALVIAVMSLGITTGCRTGPLRAVTADRADSVAPRGAPVVSRLPVSSFPAPRLSVQEASVPATHDFQPAVYIQDEVDEGARTAEGPELLPRVNESPRAAISLSLADLQGIALQSNPALASAAARIEAARGRHFQAGRYPNPVVGYHATEIGNLGTAGQQGGFASQRFVTGGKLQLDQAVAGKEIDEAHFRFHAEEIRVLRDVRLRFYDVLAAQQRVELTEKLVGVGEDVVRATEKLLQGRLGTANDLLQAEIRAEEARVLRDKARNLADEAWRRLTLIVGVPGMPTTPLSGELTADVPVLDWDGASAEVLSENPELAAARARAERAGLAIARATKEPIPDVDFYLSVRHHNVTRSDVANLQVGIPIPVFDKNRGGIRRAEADWIAASNDVRRVELELQDRLAVAFRRYADARQQADRYRQRLIPKSLESLELVRRGYETGQVTYLTLLTAQQSIVELSLAHLDALQALRASAVEIESLESRRVARD